MMTRETRMELKGFALFWIVVFASVPLMYFIQYLTGHDKGMDFMVIFLNWLEILPYFILFCIHNFLLIPLLLKKKFVLYAIGSIALFALFTYYILATIIGPPAGADGTVEVPPGVQRPFRPEVMKIFIGALLILVNLGIKAMVRAAENEREIQVRVKEALEMRASEDRQQEKLVYFKSNYKIVPVKVSDVCYVESFGPYMRIYLESLETPLIVLSSFKQILQELPDNRFVRIHKSYLVDIDRITAAGKSSVTLNDGRSLPVGDTYRTGFMERFCTEGGTRTLTPFGTRS